MVHSIMRHVAETTGANLEELYQQIAWPLYRMYGHAYDAFRGMIQVRPAAAAVAAAIPSCCGCDAGQQQGSAYQVAKRLLGRKEVGRRGAIPAFTAWGQALKGK
jgi:hypothetical protein